MSFLKVGVVLLSVFSLTPLYAAQNVGGGNRERLIFAQARFDAITALNQISEEKLVAQAIPSNEAQWILEHKSAMVDDVSRSFHSWHNSLPAECAEQHNACACTTFTRDAAIEFAFDNCRNTEAKEAIALLIHESAHHLGASDESFADAIAIDVMRATGEQRPVDPREGIARAASEATLQNFVLDFVLGRRGLVRGSVLVQPVGGVSYTVDLLGRNASSLQGLGLYAVDRENNFHLSIVFNSISQGIKQVSVSASEDEGGRTPLVFHRILPETSPLLTRLTLDPSIPSIWGIPIVREASFTRVSNSDASISLSGGLEQVPLEEIDYQLLFDSERAVCSGRGLDVSSECLGISELNGRVTEVSGTIVVASSIRQADIRRWRELAQPGQCRSTESQIRECAEMFQFSYTMELPKEDLPRSRVYLTSMTPSVTSCKCLPR